MQTKINSDYGNASEARETLHESPKTGFMKNAKVTLTLKKEHARNFTDLFRMCRKRYDRGQIGIENIREVCG